MAWKAAHDAVERVDQQPAAACPRPSARCATSTARAVEAECADFRAALDAANGGFAEPFMTAPSPGIIAAAMRNA